MNKVIYGPGNTVMPVQPQQPMQQVYYTNGGGIPVQPQHQVVYPVNNGYQAPPAMMPVNGQPILQPGAVINTFPTNPPMQPGLQQAPQQMTKNWYAMLMDIFNFQAANPYIDKVNGIQQMAKIAEPYGFRVQGCGQNRLVIDADASLDGINQMVIKIASCNLGVMDNMGEYLLTSMLGGGEDIIAPTVVNLQTNESVLMLKPTSKSQIGGRFIAQHKVLALSDIAQSIKDNPAIASQWGIMDSIAGMTMSQIAHRLLKDREQERKLIIAKLKPVGFIYDLDSNKPFNFGINPKSGKLVALDYGYVVPWTVFDMCAGAQRGTYTATVQMNVGGMNTTVTGMRCHKCGATHNNLMEYQERDGVEEYACKCGALVSAADIKGRLVKSWGE